MPTLEDTRVAMSNRDLKKPAGPIIAQMLHGWANQIAARFNAPVYLVGSALTEAHPRDVDVRVVLPDDAFIARYGISSLRPHFLGPDPAPHLMPSQEEEEQARRVVIFWRDVAKIGGWASRHHSLNVDFQVQSDADPRAEQYATKPRVRLDSLGELPVPEDAL